MCDQAELHRHHEDDDRRREELHYRIEHMVSFVADVINNREQVADHSETFETDEL